MGFGWGEGACCTSVFISASLAVSNRVSRGGSTTRWGRSRALSPGSPSQGCCSPSEGTGNCSRVAFHTSSAVAAKGAGAGGYTPVKWEMD